MTEPTTPTKGRFILSKEFGFEAAHQLQGHDGKCARLHGHSFKLKVFVVGTQLHKSGPQRAMLMDYGHISNIVRPVVDQLLDHQFLNETLECSSPTSEFIALYLFELLAPKFAETPDRCQLEAVEINETCTSGCVFQSLLSVEEQRRQVIDMFVEDISSNGRVRQEVESLIERRGDETLRGQ